MSNPRRPAQFGRETGDSGEFVRQDSAFRRWVEPDGDAEFPAAPGRYHLYVSYACPWAHRVMIGRKLKGLEEAISLSVVDPIRDDRGWAFTDAPGCGPDPINGFAYLAEAYRATDPSFDARVTVPVLWDRETNQIVNNESSEILRMLNGAFGRWSTTELDLYPEAHRAEIDKVNGRVYDDINNGVYRCGFATSQQAYEQAFARLFDALAWVEGRLATQRYLVPSAEPTEADWRLFTTLVRFDAVYVGHFKCNLRRIADHPNLSRYLGELYDTEGVAETVQLDHIKRHYYVTHDKLNPSGIVPIGPELPFLS